MFRRLLPFAVGLLALAMVLGLRLVDPQPVQQVRQWVFDTYQRIEPRPYQPAGVRIVDIDEASLARLGQWPWPRTLVADLVVALRDMGAAVIAFDVVFSEPDGTAPSRLLQTLDGAALGPGVRAALAALPDPDAVLGAAIATAPVVTGFAPNSQAAANLPALKAGFAFLGAAPGPFLQNFSGATVNLPAIAEPAAGNGSFGIANDFDSVMRRVPLFQTVNGQVYPALTSEALRVGQGAKTHLIETSAGTEAEAEALGGRVGVVRVKIGRIEVPTTARGEVLLHDTGYQPARYLPAWRVLEPAMQSRVAPLVAGHIVLIGTSAAGLKDVRATPLSPSIPGVSVHAQALEQMILGHHLERPDWATGLEVLAFLGVGVVLVALLPLVGAVWSSVLAVMAIAVGIGASWYAFSELRFLFDPVYPALAVLAIYVPTTATLFVQTESERRFVRAAFARYLSPALVERLARNPDSLRLGGETRELTILFSDIRGFTTLSEGMTPEELTRFMNRYLTPMSDRILEREGFIDKYIGDAIMAFWNAPLDVADHAAAACRAALDMRAVLIDLNAAWTREYAAEGRVFPGVAFGIGLHTGACSVGNMGSDTRFNFSILGDNVNLASRIEGQTKTYGVDILVSEATAEAAVDGFTALEIDRIQVKGRSQPVSVHVLVGERSVARAPGFAAFRDRHMAMLDAWRAEAWAEAAEACEDCRRALAGRSADWLPPGCRLGGIYALYAERLEARLRPAA